MGTRARVGADETRQVVSRAAQVGFTRPPGVSRRGKHPTLDATERALWPLKWRALPPRRAQRWTPVAQGRAARSVR